MGQTESKNTNDNTFIVSNLDEEGNTVQYEFNFISDDLINSNNSHNSINNRYDKIFSPDILPTLILINKISDFRKINFTMCNMINFKNSYSNIEIITALELEDVTNIPHDLSGLKNLNNLIIKNSSFDSTKSNENEIHVWPINLTNLLITSTDLSNINIKNLSNLEKLFLVLVKINSRINFDISELLFLKTLLLIKVNIFINKNDIDIINICNNLHIESDSLMFLNLSQNNATCININCPNLVNVILSDNLLSNIDLSYSPKIEILDLEKNNISDLKNILIKTENLRDFNIANNPVLSSENIYNSVLDLINYDFRKSQINICVICGNVMFSNRITLLCNHEFCYNCILEWIDTDKKITTNDYWISSCPICKNQIDEYIWNALCSNN
jgi:hypothetical protein